MQMKQVDGSSSSAVSLYGFQPRFYFAYNVRVSSTAATSLSRGLSTGGGGQKLLPTAVAAKVVRLAIAFGGQSGGFVHGHSANRVFGHGFRFFHGHVSFLVLFVTVL